MDGENNGKPYEQMDDLGGFPIIFGNTHMQFVPLFTTVFLNTSKRWLVVWDF